MADPSLKNAAAAADFLIVDCGLGNLHSVAAGLRRVAPGADIRVAADPEDIRRAAKIVLPGDGHFNACACEIRRRGLESALRQAAREKPFFGICVGMQILYESSDESGDENGEPGLGLFPGRVRKLPGGDGRKIPHMGWNTIRANPGQSHPILDGVTEGARFYFIHSFCAPPGPPAVAVADYGGEFAAVAARGMLVAAQFHPEKSARRGLQMLANFAAPDFAARAQATTTATTTTT